jgi:hypothetical protein
MVPGHGLTTGVQDPAEAGIISLCHHVQTSSEVHLASYPMGNSGCFTCE